MEQFLTIGKSVKRVDALEKVTGQGMFTSDVMLPHMLHAKILRSPYAHARITHIDVSEAEELPGVKTVVTGKDAPDEKLYLFKDRYVLARDVVRFVGEPVAAVAADTIEIAEEALDLIEVDYEEMPAVFDPEEAMKPNPTVVVHPEPGTRYWSPFYQGPDPSKALINEVAAERPNVHTYGKVRDGDTEKGFQESDLIIEERYVRPRIQHVPMEPHATVVRPESDGGLTLWVTSQTIYPEKEHICRIFKMPFNKVRVIGLYQGGGFGSRVEGLGASIHITVLLALKAKRPVKLMYKRDEVFIDGITEMPMVMYIKDGVKKDGTILAREMKVVINAGAYSGNNPIGAYNTGWASGGTYKVANFKFDAYVVYTNEPVSGPFRGFGANPPEWAIEAQMDLLAEKLGMDPAEIRRKHMLKEGEESNLGETTTNIAIEDSLNKVLDYIEWGKASEEEQKGPWKKGKGIALSNKFTTGSFASAVTVKAHPDATYEVHHSAIDLGQGCNTALSQIASEELQAPVDKIKIISVDTVITPPDHGTISNRVTWHTGNALRLACKDLKRQMFDRASAILRVPPENLILEDGLIHKKKTEKVALRIFDFFAFPGLYLPKDGELVGRGTYVSPVIPLDPETGKSPRIVSYYSWGACSAEVAVNVETGEIKVLRVGQCFDMGRSINPALCEGQTEGGIGQGIGSALFEEQIVKDGVVMNPNLIDYRIPSFSDIPTENIKAMIAECEPHEEGPYGAKGFAEGGLLPMTPAITNAVADAVGVRIRIIPITRERLLKGLGALEKKD